MVSKRKNNGSDDASTSKKVRPEEVIESADFDTAKKKKKSKKSKKDNLNTSDSYVDTSSEPETIVKEPPKPLVEEHAHFGEDIPNWPLPHMSELLRKMETLLPQKDTLVYKSRAERLNWEQIAFENYSAVECRVMWETIQKRLRRFRVLQELIDDAKVWISKPWTNFYRSSKTNRHPDMPRRPLTTYMLFYMKKKDKVLKEHPGLDVTGLSKHIAEMYKKIPPKTKEKYNKLAAAQRKEYDEKLKEFYRVHPELVPTQIKVGSTSINNDNNMKKPVTPFKLFYEDCLKKHADEPDFDKVNFLDRCKEQWKSLSDKKKVLWINWAVDRETKYQEDVKSFQAEHPDYVAPHVIKSILTKEERTIQERMAGKPEKPPNSAYSLFSRLMLASEEIKNVSPKQRMLLIAQQWKNLNDTEKKQYNDKVKHMLEQYKLQYAEYLESLPEDKRQEELLNNQPKKKKPSKKAVKSLTPVLEGKASSSTKAVKTKAAKKPAKDQSSKSVSSNQGHLFEGEPEQPPATPFLLYAKTIEQNKQGSIQKAQKMWDSMDEEQQGHYRKQLWDLKREYIVKYELFLKGLTQEELKQYSQWKKTTKQAQESDESSGSESEHEECSDDESD